MNSPLYEPMEGEPARAEHDRVARMRSLSKMEHRYRLCDDCWDDPTCVGWVLALNVACAYCGALPFEGCRMPSGRETSHHRARRDLAAAGYAAAARSVEAEVERITSGRRPGPHE